IYMETIPCTGLTVSPSYVTVRKNKTIQLVCTITPANATNKTLSYTPSDPTYATVNGTGLVTGIEIGTTSVIVSTTDGSNIQVNVPVKVEKLADNYTIPELASIYNFPAPSNQNYVVGIASFGSGLYGTATAVPGDPSLLIITDGDAQLAWANMGIAPENYPLVLLKLMPGATNQPALGCKENTLDVVSVGGACPTSKLTIIVYMAPEPPNEPSFYGLFNFIYTTSVVIGTDTYSPPNAVSCSWGGLEKNYDLNMMNQTSALFKTMTEAGINIMVASGDYGSCDQPQPQDPADPSLNVDFPSSSPYTVCVGGTTLSCPNLVYDTSTVEAVWNDGGYATGGGVSTIFDKPSYQNITALSAYTKRCIPDIALDADLYTMTGFYNNFVPDTGGGTSFTAPLFTAFLASINCRKWVTPILYTAPSNCFHDITSGNNNIINPPPDPLNYSAATGFDLCTGWGSINGLYLQDLLSDIPCTGLTVSPNPAYVQKTKTVQLVSTITPANATNRTLGYTTSDPTYATVNGTGLVYGNEVGAATVTVSTTDGSNLSVPVTVSVSNNPICVARNTMILMEDGSIKSIQDIKRGDRVLCDKESGISQNVALLIEMTYEGEAIKLPSGLLGNENDIIITSHHPVWIGNHARIFSKDIRGGIPITICETVYNIQFENEGSYYAEGVKMDSLSPNFGPLKLPRSLYFRRLKHNKKYIIRGEDDPRRGKPPMTNGN
ncbi:MAG: Ig-like domain-containing protein, partial [Chryseobacterium sp.]